MADFSVMSIAALSRLSADGESAKAEIERRELQAQLAAMDAPDPLLIEAREICAKECDGCTYQAGQIAPDALYRSGFYDNEGRVRIALAALRRGMELAPRPVVDDAAKREIVEAVIEAHSTTRTTRDVVPWILGRHKVQEAFATLSRAPLASPPWPVDVPSPETFYEWALGWREADDHDGIEGQESQMLWRVCSTVHRRLREHMTGDAS